MKKKIVMSLSLWPLSPWTNDLCSVCDPGVLECGSRVRTTHYRDSLITSCRGKRIAFVGLSVVILPEVLQIVYLDLYFGFSLLIFLSQPLDNQTFLSNNFAK